MNNRIIFLTETNNSNIIKKINKNLKTFNEHSIPIYVERHRAVDIDTPEDWKQAEIAAKYLFKK